MTPDELRALADALPEGVHWSDPITPEMLAEAIKRFCADAQPVAEVNDRYSRDGYNDEISVLLPVGTKLYTHPAPAAPQAERDELRDLLLRAGFVQCDIPACNCGSWHHRYGLPERMQEIKDALAEAGHELSNANGNLPINALKALVAERDELRRQLAEAEMDAERYRWLRGGANIPPESTRWARWEVRHWDGRHWNTLFAEALDTSIDAAMGASNE